MNASRHGFNYILFCNDYFPLHFQKNVIITITITFSSRNNDYNYNYFHQCNHYNSITFQLHFWKLSGSDSASKHLQRHFSAQFSNFYLLHLTIYYFARVFVPFLCTITQIVVVKCNWIRNVMITNYILKISNHYNSITITSKIVMITFFNYK